MLFRNCSLVGSMYMEVLIAFLTIQLCADASVLSYAWPQALRNGMALSLYMNFSSSEMNSTP